MCAILKMRFEPGLPAVWVLGKLIDFFAMMRTQSFQPCHLQNFHALVGKRLAQFFGQKKVARSKTEIAVVTPGITLEFEFRQFKLVLKQRQLDDHQT